MSYANQSEGLAVKAILKVNSLNDLKMSTNQQNLHVVEFVPLLFTIASLYIESIQHYFLGFAPWKQKTYDPDDIQHWQNLNQISLFYRRIQNISFYGPNYDRIISTILLGNKMETYKLENENSGLKTNQKSYIIEFFGIHIQRDREIGSMIMSLSDCLKL